MTCGFIENGGSDGVTQAFNVISGSYLTPATCIPAAGNAVMIPNTLYLFPFRTIVRATGVISNVTVIGVLSSMRMGLYGADADGKPNGLIEESGVIATTALGIKTFAFSATRSIARPVWVGAIFDVACSMQTTTSSGIVTNNVIGSATLASTQNVGVSTPVAFGALPADLTGAALTYFLNTGPLMALVTA